MNLIEMNLNEGDKRNVWISVVKMMSVIKGDECVIEIFFPM